MAMSIALDTDQPHVYCTVMAKSNVPQFVWRRRALVLKAIERLKDEDRPCHRCEGHGYLDREDWIVTEDNGGRVCFACRGSGQAKVLTYPEPIAVRRAVAYKLLPLVRVGDSRIIKRMKETERQRIYWPVLIDVFDRATAAAEKVAGV